jgi:hypothetical protein
MASKREAALLREGDVDKHGIGPELLGSRERVRCRRGGAYDGQALPLEQDARDVEKRLAVIHYEYAK